MNCIDKSDEYYCDYLRFGENYASGKKILLTKFLCFVIKNSTYISELVPRDESGNPLIVYMNVSVLAFPFIETMNLKFTADYFLNLKWYDLR